MSIDYLGRLRTDPRAEDARQRLKSRGMRDAETWKHVIEELAAVPNWYEHLRHETRPARDARRAKLVRKTGALAEAFRNDPEARLLRVYDHASITSSNITDRPKISDFLSDVAEYYEARSSLLDGFRLERKQTLKSFALRRAFEILNDAVHLQRAPNREAELLVSALLDEEISAGTLTQIRKKGRRKYTTEK